MKELLTNRPDTADQMLDFILQREGGFVNDPKDPGRPG